MANPLTQGASAPELARLRDIHLPAPIGWWPLAPGWYLLAFILVVLFFVVGFVLFRFYRNGRFKRQALQLLTSYQQQYQKEGACQLSAARVSELLKRVALIYFPRSSVASLQGDEWLSFLNRTGKRIDFTTVREALLEVPYQSRASCDLSLLFKISRGWIRQRRGTCLS